MSFFMLRAIKHGIESALLSMEMESEVADRISNTVSLHTIATFADHHIYQAFSQEELLEAFGKHSKAMTMNQIATNSDALANETKKIIASFDDLDSKKTEEIFSRIDLAQARIAKDQEEIQFLAAETDELLNQLEYKAS